MYLGAIGGGGMMRGQRLWGIRRDCTPRHWVEVIEPGLPTSAGSLGKSAVEDPTLPEAVVPGLRKGGERIPQTVPACTHNQHALSLHSTRTQHATIMQSACNQHVEHY